MKVKRIHHIGVIMPTVEKANNIMKTFELEIDQFDKVPIFQSDLIFTKFGEHECPIEFIIPSGGVLAQFNNGRGGIHHICYEVENIQVACDELKANGYELLEPQPVMGTQTLYGNFIRPRSMEGILFELVEVVTPKK